jgi:hypothetical protein
MNEVILVDRGALQQGRVEIWWDAETGEEAGILRITPSERASCVWLALEMEGEVVARIEILADTEPVDMEEMLTIAIQERWV